MLLLGNEVYTFLTAFTTLSSYTWCPSVVVSLNCTFTNCALQRNDKDCRQHALHSNVPALMPEKITRC